VVDRDAAIDRLIESDQAAPKRVLVVGDVIDDVWVHGTLHDSQDGCQKFVEALRVHTPGGAAGAARQLQNWKCKVSLNCDVDLPPIISTKTRYIVDNKIVFRHDLEQDYSETRDISECREWIRFYLQNRAFAAILISDYDKGLLTPQLIHLIIDHCKDEAIPCVVDAKREPELYAGAIIKGNEDYWRKHLITIDAKIVMTRGQLPPTLLLGPAPENDLPPVRCINHVGAGDSFAAHLVLGLAYGLSLEESAIIAHSAGRVYVQHQHGRPPTPQEIRDDMKAPCSVT
jgi:bifunctional ADP-heptose synthase (sugar kinase/adenylyltransferase)